MLFKYKNSGKLILRDDGGVRASYDACILCEIIPSQGNGRIVKRYRGI